MIEVDARGLSCPIPVVKTQKALDKNRGAEIVVLVNDQTAKENVTRLANSKKYTIEARKEGDEFRLILKPEV